MKLAISKEENSNKNVEEVTKIKMKVNEVRSKLASIKFKIERKCIKNKPIEERKRSIVKLEEEKHLSFHPKNGRSKSIPHINMNLRIEALRDMKEDLMIRNSKVSGEI